MCPPKRICSHGFCWDEDFKDIIDQVDLENQEDRRTIENVRGDDDSDYTELYRNIDKLWVENEFEYLWGKTGDLFDSASVPGKVFKAVSHYFNFIKKTRGNLNLRGELDQLIANGEIDPEQAEMIKNLDATAKAVSVLSGYTGADSLYPQGAILDTAMDMVVKEAIRSGKYGYCRDILVKYGANPTDPIKKQTVNRCLDRQVTAGIFK